MQVIKNENTIFCDVDHTLILPVDENNYQGRRVHVYDVVTDAFITMIAHEPNIRLLKEEASKGFHVVVWSKGGYQWAVDVVMALGLDLHVHQVMTKPKTYIDDLPVSKWLKDRIYLDPQMVYKK